MTKRRVRSAKGVIVDFNLMEVKEQIASTPKSTDVTAREDFIEQRLKRRARRLAEKRLEETKRKEAEKAKAELERQEKATAEKTEETSNKTKTSTPKKRVRRIKKKTEE